MRELASVIILAPVPQQNSLATTKSAFFQGDAMMRTRLIRQPGQPGTKKLVEQYGTELVCVRYRYDDQRGKRYKTVELIVEESAYAPPSKLKPNTIVGLRISLAETVLQKKVKQAGGIWNRNRQLWEIRYDRVVELGLEGRIESGERSTNRSFVETTK